VILLKPVFGHFRRGIQYEGCCRYSFTRSIHLRYGMGQATAQIHGTVQDASVRRSPRPGQSHPNETGITRETMSGSDGGYVLTNLATRALSA